MDLAERARKYSLQNAIKYNGKAQPKAVLGKLMRENPELNAQEILTLVKRTINDINTLSVEEQLRELEETAPDFLVKKEKEKKTLPDLPEAHSEKVITRFPPEPNGYLHIGHAKAAVIDYEYAKKYGGAFILRFDDTNPLNESIEFYDVQKEDLQWLGITWDKEYRTSDNLPRHYKLAEKLLNDNHAYLCQCQDTTIKKTRKNRVHCPCRESPATLQWKDFFSMDEGEAILRLKGDMQSANTAMRDPTLFRIIDHPHPVHDTKYRIWPTYDFSGAVEDSLSGVTHPFRTKEYELRDEVYFLLLDYLGLRKPCLMEFSRLSIKGMPVSKRKIKPLIDNKSVSGWDDPRLPTLRGLRRRGILPTSIKEFVLSQGISKAESVVTFDQVEAINRKALDPTTKRYFFVPDPIKLDVSDAPQKTILVKNHPSSDLGTRHISASTIFYIPQMDAEQLQIGETFRLKDLYNVTLTHKNDILKGQFAGDSLISETKKIQWVSSDHQKLLIKQPTSLFINGIFQQESLHHIMGYAEEEITNIKDNETVQFERFGFVKLEKRNHKLTGIFIHK